MNLLKMPIACLLILLYTFYLYLKNKRIPTRASLILNCLMGFSIFHLISEIITEYTVNHRDSVSELFNYIWHIFFLISLFIVCFSIYSFVLTYIEHEIRHPKTREKICAAIFSFAIILALIFLPIEYIDTPHGSYSLGPKAYALYIGVIYILFMLTWNIIRYWKKIEKKKREVLTFSILIFLLFAGIQICYPYILTTGLAVTLIVLGILYTTEDTKQYIDQSTNFFNKNGFETILEEWTFYQKNIHIPLYVCTGSRHQIHCCFSSLSLYMNKQYHYSTFFIADNMLAFLPLSPDKYMSTNLTIETLREVLSYEHPETEDYISFTFSKNSSVQEILQTIYSFKDTHEEKFLLYDSMTGIYNRNAYECDIHKLSETPESLWYILLDLNHLKETNDTYGHFAGDELIQTTAALLKETFSSPHKIYRIGGDEFVVFSMDIEITPALQKLENNKNQINRSRKLPLSYALGYAYYDPLHTEWSSIIHKADYYMYQDKLSGRTQ